MDYIYLILILIIVVLGAVIWVLYKNRAKKPATKAGGGILEEEMRNKEANKRKILKFMEEKSLIADMDQLRIVNNDVEKLLGVSNATAERYLHELEEEGILKQLGIVGRGVYYEKIK
jgi:Fic family protein